MPKEYGKFIFETANSKKINISSNIKISNVTNKRDFLIFFKTPWKIYENDEYWIPPFWNEIKNFFHCSNPFWTHSKSQLFVAYKNNQAVGRIASIIDYDFPEINGKKVGFFGFFECIQNSKIALNLLEVAQEWLISNKINIMHGPVNGRVDLGSGFLYKGFNSMPYLCKCSSNL